jgi:hypothetical protein
MTDHAASLEWRTCRRSRDASLRGIPEVSWQCSEVSLLVPSERLAGTAGDARIRGRAGAESRKGIGLRDADRPFR